jgi:hypothetical protein
MGAGPDIMEICGRGMSDIQQKSPGVQFIEGRSTRGQEVAGFGSNEDIPEENTWIPGAFEYRMQKTVHGSRIVI